MIVHHDRQHVSRCAIGAEENEIVNFTVLNRHFTLNRIGNGHLSSGFGFQTDHIGRAFRCFGRITIPPAAVIAHRLFFRLLLLAHGGQFF